MFTDFEFADKRLSDFGWIAGHIGGDSGVSEIDIGCDITFNTVKNNHSSIHYISSSSYENVCTLQPFDIFKNPCGNNQEDMYITNDEVSALTRWLNRHEYRKFKPLYTSDNSDIHYYGSFNVKKKIINDKIVGLSITFNSNAPYGFGEKINNEFDMDNNEVTVSGTTVSVLDSANVPPVSMKLFGKSTQNTVPGNQLLEIFTHCTMNATLSDDGLTITSEAKTGDSYVNLLKGHFDPIQLLAGQSYYVSADIKLVSGSLSSIGAITLMNESANVIGSGQNVELPSIQSTYQRYVVKVTVSSDSEAVGLYVQGITATDAVVEVTNVMIAQNTYEHEPFVGGETSPNMNYPQEVIPVGVNGNVVAKVLTRQLFDYMNADIKNWYIANSGIGEWQENYSFVLPITPNQTYYIKDKNAVTLRYALYSEYPTLDSEPIEKVLNTSYSDLEVSVGENAHYMLVQYYGNWSSIPDMSGIMVSLVDVDYEQYTEQSVAFQTPNGLHGIPLGQTIPDAIANSPVHMSGVYYDGEQYWICDSKNEDGKNVQRIRRETVVLNRYDYSITPKGYRYEGNLNGSSLMTSCFCDIALYNSGAGGSTSNNGIRLVPSMSLAIIECESDKESITATIVYILAEPIETELTEEEIEQYNALSMNYPNTTIVNDANAYMEIIYLQDYDKEFTICGYGDEYTVLYPNIFITCKQDGDLRIKNKLTGNLFEILNCSKGETILVNGEYKFIDSDNETHKSTTLFNDFNYNYLDIKISEDESIENIYETSMPCKIVINYSPIRKVGV